MTILMYSCFTGFSAWSQEYQDYLSDIFDTFPGLQNPENTGLTTLPVLEISAGGEQRNLGNAYTAVARDVSFMEANAAASSILEFTELAFYHRNIISDVSLDSVFFTRRHNNFGYGFAGKFLHFEFTRMDSRGNQVAAANPSEMVFAANASYNFLDNFYSSGLALGVNLKLAHRNVPGQLYRGVLDPDEYNQNLFAFMGDIGLLSRFNFLKGYAARDKNFSLGATVLNLGPPVKGDALPTEAVAGISYRPLRFIMISSDINYMMNLVDFTKSEGLGFALGADFRFVDFFSIQTGIDWKGYNPSLSFGADVNLEPVSFQVNYTLDLSTSVNSVDNFSVAASVNFGDEGREALQNMVDEIYIHALTALSNGEFRRVIELCDRIIDRETGLDPSFTPAYRTREVALTTLEREEEFRDFEQNRTEEAQNEADE